MAVVVRTRPPPPYPFTPPAAGSGSDTATSANTSLHSSPSNADVDADVHFHSPSRSPSEGNDPFIHRENLQSKTPHSTSLGPSGKENSHYVPISVHRRLATKLHCSEKTLEQLQARHAESLKGLHGEISRLQDVCATLSAQVMEGRRVENAEEVQEPKKDSESGAAEGNQKELMLRLRIECDEKQREIDRLVQQLENATLQLSQPTMAENANVSDGMETDLNSRKKPWTVTMRGRRYGSNTSLTTTGPMIPYPPDSPHHQISEGAEQRLEGEGTLTSDEISNRTLPTPRSTLPPIKSSSQSKLSTRVPSENLLNFLGGSKSSSSMHKSSASIGSSSQTILPEIHAIRESCTFVDPSPGSSGQPVPSRSAAALASVPLKKAISRRFSLRPKKKEEA